MSASKPLHWADIQQNTFLRWVNEHLRDRAMHLTSLATDFSNGLALINLMEIISSKSVGRYNKHPKVPQQKLENCEIAIRFIQQEGVKLVNIGGIDINEGKLKLILGLIWTLIIRYEINKNTGGNEGESELLRWVQSKIPDYNIKNFTTDWNNGKALCALVNALRPNQCKDHAAMNAADALKNATHGITTAEDTMGVAALITGEELIHPKVDKTAVMCYIAQFRNVGEFDESHLCSAWGNGLVEGVINEPQLFTVHGPHHGQGAVSVNVKTPSGKEEKVEMEQKGHEYNMKYTPRELGVYEVAITYNGKPIPGSVFRALIREYESLGGEGKIQVFFSTTSASEKGRQDVFNLENLLTSKKIHLRSDFEPWTAVDLMTREDREAVFKRAGSRVLPIIFIDDKYIGDYDTLVQANEEGRLDKLLKLMGDGGVSAASASMANIQISASTGGAQPAAAVKANKCCTSCGDMGTGAFCSTCGGKLV